MTAMRTIALFLVFFLALGVGHPAAAEDASPFTGIQRDEIDRMIGDYIRRNPEVILDAVRALQARDQEDQQRRQTEGVAAHRADLEHDDSDPIIGNPSGEITVVEFFDYRCPYCKGMLPSILQVLKGDSHIRYVMKEFPILTPESRVASRAALAAWQIDKSRYFDFHVRLMENKGELNDARILDMAKSAGLDPKKLRQAMDDPGIERQLSATADLARDIGITGTPAFIVGDRLVPGAMDVNTFRELIADARDKKPVR